MMKWFSKLKNLFGPKEVVKKDILDIIDPRGTLRNSGFSSASYSEPKQVSNTAECNEVESDYNVTQTQPTTDMTPAAIAMLNAVG